VVTASELCVFHSPAKLSSLVGQLASLEDLLWKIHEHRTYDGESPISYLDVGEYCDSSLDTTLLELQSRLGPALSNVVRNHAHALAGISPPREIVKWENRVRRLLKENLVINTDNLEERPKDREGKALRRKYLDLRLALEQVRSWKDELVARCSWVDQDLPGWAALL
jgi:hypothetical protein